MMTYSPCLCIDIMHHGVEGTIALVFHALDGAHMTIVDIKVHGSCKISRAIVASFPLMEHNVELIDHISIMKVYIDNTYRCCHE